MSLTFFETCVLRELRQQGCRQIYVIVDADGYQSSLSERRSTRVGQEYRVIPVALPKGVFHPKCTYLSGPDGDVLAIGSGNITFGGYGRNLEVFEILEPMSAPLVFEEFANFLDNLGNRSDITIPDKTWIPMFSMLSRRHVNISNSNEYNQPQLLHSTTIPIIDQIVNAASLIADSTLTVLSPFHDTVGTAVKRLAKGVGATKIRVALPTRHASETTFPFNIAKSWGVALSAVTPEAESPNRCLHAKWFQIDRPGSETITVSGSINATSKALCSIDNIEVGILRKHSTDEGFVTWGESDIPKETTTLAYNASGLGNKCIVHAVLKSDSSLVGWLIATKDFAGEWGGFLESSTGEQCAITVTVNVEGRFATSVTASNNLLFATGLQVSLTKDDRRARGWVLQEDILKLGREQRTIIRFLSNEDTIDDEVALLDYLALSLNRHAPQFGSRIKVIKNSDDSNNTDKGNSSVVIHLADIAPVLDVHGNEIEITRTDGHAGEMDLFARLRRYLLGERYTPQKEPKVVGIESTEDDDENEYRIEQARKKKIVNHLDAFERCIQKCLDETSDNLRRRAALVYWFEIKLHILKRHDWSEEGLVFVKTWFRRACSEKLLHSPFEALEQHVFTAASVLALTLSDDDSRHQNMVMLHEDIERFAGGPIDTDLAQNLLIDNPEAGFASLLVPSRESELANALDEALKTVTLRTQLETELNSHEAGKPINNDLILFKTASGQKFIDSIKRIPGIISYRTVKTDTPYCPFCFTVWAVQAGNDLKYNRIAQCTNCSKFAVNVTP
ncbi:MAG: hypothetical protein PHF56_20230 [Desulfuromonadaceae bacterium]|nr:hypothetical protein [Desulfuromonadaceae bacterium]